MKWFSQVRLKDFVEILEANDVKVNLKTISYFYKEQYFCRIRWFSKMEDEELEEFTSLSDEAGEISKHDLIVQTKKSSFWKGNLDLKNKPSGHSTKVSILYQIRIFYSFICKTSRNRNKSSYPYGVDIFGNIVTKNVFSIFGNRKCCILYFLQKCVFPSSSKQGKHIAPYTNI